MEPESSLLHAQVIATCPILSQINPVHASPSHFLKIHFILSSHLHLGVPVAPSFGFPRQTPMYTSLVSHMYFV